MNRTIKAYYEISEDRERITLYITDESNNSINRYVGEYTFNNFKNDVDFYNTLLERYDAEYDNDFAEVLDELRNKIVKEGVFDDKEDSTQD